MSLNFTTKLYLAGLAISVFFYFKFRAFNQKSPNIVGEFFKQFALVSSIGLFIFSFFFMFFEDNPFLLGIAVILGDPFYFLSFIYGFALFFLMVKPNFPSKYIFIIGGLIILLNIFLDIIFFPYPSFNEYGILSWNTLTIPDILYLMVSLTGLIPLSIAFIYEGIKQKELRIRSWLLAFSLLLFFITGILLSSYIQNKSAHKVALIIQTIGFLCFLSAGLSRVKLANSVTYPKHPLSTRKCP